VLFPYRVLVRCFGDGGFGTHLLPVNDPKVPKTQAWFKREAPVGAFAAVEVWGTSFERMADRARLVATHALRVLRVALVSIRASLTNSSDSA